MTIQQHESSTDARRGYAAAGNALTPEAVVEQLRAIRSQIGEVTPISTAQREAMRNDRKAGARDHSVEREHDRLLVAGAAGPRTVRRRMSVTCRRKRPAGARWRTSFARFSQAVSGTNYARRHQLALISAQAYSIGTQLVRDPANAELLPHVREIKRLRALARGANRRRRRSRRFRRSRRAATVSAPARSTESGQAVIK